MNLIHSECSILLQMLQETRPELSPAILSQHAGIPSQVITDFNEYGDFRMCHEDEDMKRLLAWLRHDRALYAKTQLHRFTNDELLQEIKDRLAGG